MASGIAWAVFPKGAPLLTFDEADLDAVADNLNTWTGKTLDFATPGEHGPSSALVALAQFV
jgi:IS30 family transposase